ncbi:hypothetical protein QAD02_021426 [Eretmocerus hayati]|uniref:Uncharacterized protein n=1 Tax=Eretmocerus hayati TaxID=131215 RepID=A0ACC2PRK8_9HYME|nr:hypothetical protein QAD02_021426 [Eretmocerus hayati]
MIVQKSDENFSVNIPDDSKAHSTGAVLQSGYVSRNNDRCTSGFGMGADEKGDELSGDIRHLNFEHEMIESQAKTLACSSSEHFLPEPTIEMIVDTNYNSFQKCKERFFDPPWKSKMSDSDREFVMNSFSSSFACQPAMFDSKEGCLRNSYCRTKFYETKFEYVPPVPIPIHDEFGRETQFNYSYVPVMDPIKVMLNNPVIHAYCFDPFHENRGTKGFHDVSDGRIIKSSAFSQHPYVLQLAPFHDAFEVCNPLGSDEKKSKIIDNIQRTPPGSPTQLSSNVQETTPESSIQAPLDTQTARDNQLDFHAFQIPWHKISTADEKALTSGSRDGTVHMSVAKVKISELRVINTYNPVKTLRRLAKEAVNRYPKAFEDEQFDGITRAAEGHYEFLTMLQNCQDNANRSKNCKRGLSAVLPIPFGKHRIVRYSQVGCSNWHPQNVEGMSPEKAGECRISFLNIEDQDLTNTLIRDHCMSLFTTSFSLPREFSNKGKKTIQDIKDKWPCLLMKILITKHFHLLTKRNIDDLKTKLMSEKGKKLLDFGYSTNPIKRQLGYKSDSSDREADTWEYLQNGSTKEYHLYMEEQHTTRADDVIDALQLLIDFHFVFGELHPLQCSCFLGFLQTQFFGIYPEDGYSKIRRQHYVGKIQTFNKQLNSF